MRDFFLGDQSLTSCGASDPRKHGGWKYFCQTCGTIWGAIHGLEFDYHCVSVKCSKHGTSYYPGGSFLRPLAWWDERNGRTLEAQLNSFDEILLRHEALIWARWIIFRKETQ